MNRKGAFIHLHCSFFVCVLFSLKNNFVKVQEKKFLLLLRIEQSKKKTGNETDRPTTKTWQKNAFDRLDVKKCYEHIFVDVIQVISSHSSRPSHPR